MNERDRKTISKLIRDDKVQAMREGRRQRAVTFQNKKKVANKKACRGKQQW